MPRRKIQAIPFFARKANRCAAAERAETADVHRARDRLHVRGMAAQPCDDDRSVLYPVFFAQLRNGFIKFGKLFVFQVNALKNPY